MMQNDNLDWISSLPEKLTQPIKLLPIEQMVSYTDHTGELAKLLKNQVQGDKYQGLSALNKLAKKLGSSSNGYEKTGFREDKTDRFYLKLKTYLQRNTVRDYSQLLLIEGASAATILSIFDRYGDEDKFPLRIPTTAQLTQILGPNGERLSSISTLRTAVYFFMRFYSKLEHETRAWLINILYKALSSFSLNGQKAPKSLQKWIESTPILLSTQPASSLADDFNKNSSEGFVHYAYRLDIPERTSLYTAVRLESLCKQFAKLPRDIKTAEDKELIEKIREEKDEKINNNWIVASKCLQILIERSIKEFDGISSDSWCDLIVELGCHPDPKLSTDQQKYWHWATSKQLDTARIAYVRRDLELIFEYLRQAAAKGQREGHMVAPRIDFYKGLLRNGLILDTRLFLGINIHNELKYKMKRKQFWDIHKVSDPDLCILALKLADNINLTTGTKSFPMRFYQGSSTEFNKLWQRFNLRNTDPTLTRDDFMHDSPYCIKRSHQGNWKWSILNEILPRPFLGRVDWTHYNL